ncbi:MAG: DUF2124 domain-containing protein [Methanomassiliicoccales archaeon]|jgi:hypothetical protein|nr:DUF2124 domain-containing protein [Methanomassiliicoccales archaeon]MDD1756710.1 DUF2124 domain-containing protein [Methanomassiliicoccales archaeon]
MEKRAGISGLTGSFKEAVFQIPDGSKVVFAGSVAVCTPFAELLAYAVKDRRFELVYLPRADITSARRMEWSEGVGFTVTGQEGDPRGPAAIVLLGGLAMPKFGCPLAQVQEVVRSLSTKGTILVGVCFMGIFEREGWAGALPFDSVIDATMEVSLTRRDTLQT